MWANGAVELRVAVASAKGILVAKKDKEGDRRRVEIERGRAGQR